MSAGQHTLRTAATVASNMKAGPPGASAPAATDPVFTVSIVDDQPVTRTGMESVVSLDPRLTVVASLPDIGNLAAAAVDCDVVLLALPTHRPTPSLEVIANAAAIGRPVITSTWDQPPTLLSAMRAGARGCITRYSPHGAVADALRVVAQGGTYICAKLVDQLHSELRQSGRGDDATGLAPREIETLQWIAQGFTQAQIASRMGLSQATVNTYAKRIRGKLNVGNKAELTRVAIALGYLNDDSCHHVA
ncbi:response regulator transcription factor [Micromonospora fulviviridis]|uniref:response regulator transcription factor n=1 Tax=Micromonospora fulviviridis TaxID=47860 RepID=UPI0033CA71A2